MPDDITQLLGAPPNEPQGIGDILGDVPKDVAPVTAPADTSWGKQIGNLVQGISQEAPKFGKAAVSNILPGLVDIPEQALNMAEYANRHIPYGLPFVGPFIPTAIDVGNRLAGAPPSPYLQATQAMRQNPALGWGGQTPAQLAAQSPIGGMVGSSIGQLPVFAGMGGLGVAAKAPLALKVATTALEGGLFSSGATALEEANRQAQETDQLNPMDIASKAAGAFLPGAAVGGAGRLAAEGLSPLFGKLTRNVPEVPPAPPRMIGQSYPNRLPPLLTGPTQPVPRGMVHYMPPAPQPPTQIFNMPTRIKGLIGKTEVKEPLLIESKHRPHYVSPYQPPSSIRLSAPPAVPRFPRYGAPTSAQEQWNQLIESASDKPIIEMGKKVPKIIKARLEVKAERLPTEKGLKAEAKKLKEPKPTKEAKVQKVEAKIITPTDLSKPKIVEAEILPPADVVADEIEKTLPFDESWRTARKDVSDTLPAQQLTPTVKNGGLRKLDVDAVFSKLKGALRQFYKDTNQAIPTSKQLSPQYAKEMTEIAKRLGGEPISNIVATEFTLAPESKFPETHVFTAKTLEGKVEEIMKLDNEYQTIYRKYKNYKDAHDEEFGETFADALNKTFSFTVNSKQYGTRTILVRRRWQPSEYEFPKGGKAEYEREKQIRMDKSAPRQEFATAAFKAVINEIRDRGDHLEIEGIKDSKVIDWLDKLPKKTQANLVLTVGVAAAIYAGNQQSAEAAPPSKLVGKVVTALAKGGWREWAGSRPIVHLVKVNMTTDMLTQGTDAASKAYFNDTMTYLSKLTQANVGSREMTTAEKELTKNLAPRELRRTPLLQGWTQITKDKAGDIAYLNQQQRIRTKNEMQRLKDLGITPGQPGRMGTYARGVQINGHDFGLAYTKDGHPINPLGHGNEFLGHLNAEIMQSQFLANYAVAAYHVFEALVASASKYPVAFAQTIHGLSTNPVYREFAIANAPPGFFEMMIKERMNNGFKGPFGIRKKFNDVINAPLDQWLEKKIGKTGVNILNAQIFERGKLGLNQTVIATHFAKDYPGGPTQYMRDWLAVSKRREQLPAFKQTEFAKTALNVMIESNKATATLPNGPMKERTVFQRTQAFSIVVSYTKGTTNQSRFVLSYFDDALAALANKDYTGAVSAMSGLLVGSVMVWGAAGSHAVPPIIWATLEQLNRMKNGSVTDVERIKDALDNAQSHVAGGYQMQHVGIRGLPLTTLPVGAATSLYHQVTQIPANRQAIFRDIAIATTVGLTPKLSQFGLLRLTYMAEQLFQGLTGSREFKAYMEGAANLALAKAVNRPAQTAKGTEHFDLTQGILHGIFNIQNPKEIEILRKGEINEAHRWPSDLDLLKHKLIKAWNKTR